MAGGGGGGGGSQRLHPRGLWRADHHGGLLWRPHRPQAAQGCLQLGPLPDSFHLPPQIESLLLSRPSAFPQLSSFSGLHSQLVGSSFPIRRQDGRGSLPPCEDEGSAMEYPDHRCEGWRGPHRALLLRLCLAALGSPTAQLPPVLVPPNSLIRFDPHLDFFSVL